MLFRHGNRRPEQPETPPPDAFEIHRAMVRDDLSLAFVREGVGGYPLLLVHGYPETKRIWWRNIRPLAEAGFEVIAPDLRGFGDSDLSATDSYDLVAYSRDLHALVHEVLGHGRCAAAGGDAGGLVMLDLALRFGDFVERLCFFNSVPPVLGQAYAEAGLDPPPLLSDATADYRIWQGRRPDALLAELDTPARRRRWVGDMYGHRLWAAPGSFEPSDIDFMTEPFGDREKLRASWAIYQLESGQRMVDESPRILEPVPTPSLLLYGPEDRVVKPDFVSRCEIAFPNRIGPLVVPGAGHFVQWERADVFNPLLAWCFRDLVLGSRTG
jgi:pimeloyl-ACP methyl ester carboxylesterase